MVNDTSIWREWDELVKKTVARFSRGNIAAQERGLLFPEEQEREEARVRALTRKWKERAKASRAA